MARRLWPLFLAFALSSCSAPLDMEQGQKGERSVLRMSLSSDASNLIPMIGADSASHAIAGHIFTALLKYDKNLELTGDLAESWEVRDEGRVMRFTLRPGLTWSDGKPLTSADVAFTWRLVTDPNTHTPYGADYTKVIKLETPNPRTVVVHYAEPFAPALGSWVGLSILPEHLLAKEDINTTDFARKPVGAGFYCLSEWRSGRTISLLANDGFEPGKPKIKKLLYRIVPDPTTQFLELTTGGLDLMSLTPVQYARVFPARPDLQERYDLYRHLGNNYTYLGFNLKRPPFDDVRVRKAINHAIDKDELILGVLLGQGKAIAAPYKPGTRWYPKDLQPYAYDLEKAKALLAEAGFEDHDGDGVLDRNGRPFSFELVTNSGNPSRELAATLIQERLKKIGIDVRLRVVEWAAFLTHFINAKNFQAVIIGWSLTPDPDLYGIWHSSQQGEGQFNFLGYENSEADRLLEAGRRTLDLDEQTAIYHAFSRVLHEDAPHVMLFAPYSLTAVSKRVKGIEPAPAGIGHNMEDWTIEREEGS